MKISALDGTELGQAELGCEELVWHCAGRSWTGLGRAGLCWAELDCIELGWTELSLTEQDWTGLIWTELDCAGLLDGAGMSLTELG